MSGCASIGGEDGNKYICLKVCIIFVEHFASQHAYPITPSTETSRILDRSEPWQTFLSRAGFPARVAAISELTFRMSQAPRHLFVTDLPITRIQRRRQTPATPGELLSPRGRYRGAFPSPPHRSALSSWTYRQPLPQQSWGRRETFTGQHHQPFCPGDPAKHPERAYPVTAFLDSRGTSSASPMLQPEPEHGTHPRPKRDTSRTLPAWPLRRRRSPFDAGCIPHPRVSSSK